MTALRDSGASSTREAASPTAEGLELVELHAARSHESLDVALAAQLGRVLPETSGAICLTSAGRGAWQLRFTFGRACPLHAPGVARAEDWPLPASQRLPIRFRDHVLGELWTAAPLPAPAAAKVAAMLAHYGAALINLTLNAESRQATEDYCASLQALEEGIVLFQESDPAAVTARLLSLVSSMVQATAGALYVLREVGKPESGLQLEQTLGMPETLLATFHGVDDRPWPDVLLGKPAHLSVRSGGGNVATGGTAASTVAISMAMLAPECVPAILRSVVVLPLSYHGVQAGVCLLFNPQLDAAQPRDFVGRLQSFGQLAAALLHRLSFEAISANSLSIARELAIAETIQKRLVPEGPPPTEEYEFAWRTIAAKNIGGDYIDVVASDLGDLYVVCADASGHGINSAMLMSSFRSTYRGNAPWSEPSDLARLLNREVVHDVGPTGMFLTAMLVRFERDTKRLSACSAGHNPTLLFRAATGAIELLESNGPPLGFVASAEYEESQVTLAPGDVLLLYTDGVTEATDTELDMFGEERLHELLRQHARGPAASLVDAVLADLAAFTGRERYDDDVSMLVVKVR
jgi:serine phosphatase RsbU (regulator of sigma subunit)